MISSTCSRAGLLEDENLLRPTLDEYRHSTMLLVKLRWVAGASMISLPLFARFLLRTELEALSLVLLGVFVLVYNVLFSFLHVQNSESLERSRAIAWGQIALDWLVTALMVHLTGGITSPAVVYFVIHAALSGTILLRQHARSLVLLVIVIVGGLAWIERAGAMPHVAIHSFEVGQGLYQNAIYIAAVLFFLGSTALALSELTAQNTQRLRRRTKHVQELYDARETFIRVATHELRAPLGASISLMRTIEQGYAGEMSEKQTQILSRVSNRLEGLRLLIDDLLDLAVTHEVSAISARLQQESVRESLETIIDRETPFAEHKQIHLDCILDEEAGVVMADDFGLGLIFGNLINNAIKYTPAGGNVSIQYRHLLPERMITVAVSDTGIGIPADELPGIFNEFFRASNAKNASIVGTGIGLASVHALVERYCGEIAFTSKENKGTTFTVSLPLAMQPMFQGGL